MRVIHAITPGDHYSPRTGSAVPTVVDGIARAAEADPAGGRQSVAIDESTYTPRYPSAATIEFRGVPAPGRRERLADIALGRLGLPRRATRAYFAPMAEAIAVEPPSIVLAHNAPVLPGLLRGSGHRVVLYAHNELLRTMSRAEIRRSLGDVAAIVCVSEALARSYRAQLPPELVDRVHVVVNGVDAERFVPAQAGAPAEPLRVRFVGRMVADKGPETLVRAARMLDRDDIEVVLVGSRGYGGGEPLSEYESGLRALAADAPGIRFEPFVDREALPALLGGSDVIVVPSQWPDPCPLTIGEGLASGAAVVASRVGGIPEQLGDAGILVEPRDADGLAAALAGLADDRARLRELQAAARARALAHDWTWTWTKLRGVLEAL